MKKPVLSRGFVVQEEVMPLDLCESKNCAPIAFITELKHYAMAANKNRSLIYKKLVDSSSVVYWEYYDEERQIFEEKIFKNYERKMFQDKIDLARIRKYLKLCRVMCRCADLEEAKRIYHKVYAVIQNFDAFLVLELLETVCLSIEMVLFVFNTAAVRNLPFLKFLLLLSKTRNLNFQSLWSYSWDIITETNLISQFFDNEQYASIPTLLTHGLQWNFCESVYDEYCKAMNFTWSADLSNCSYEVSAGRSKHRFFLILQTYFIIYKETENTHKMKALHLLWRSLPDAVISRDEMISSLKKFTNSEEEPFQICRTTVWWEPDHPPGPRSLKHLSRCSVRQALANNNKLPYDSFKSDLPRCLISYINLDE
ncbi:hypothetical protein HNY73_021971 [Argiope bruennichi]|uniref:SOCS box domain-containing protein n=1 Tax=Argiope bruennichi TaxID=94029 RepID=A0A8T0E0E7_ARGBR|nr:hypothetical protein HNY73_021971 [Argiope bruennichi]